METAILLSTNALLSSAAALVMCVVLFTRKTYPGFGFWTAGVFCLAIGAAMLVPGALPSTWVVRVSRNAALLAGLLLLLRGMLIFRGFQVSYRWEGIFALVFLAVFGYYSLDPNQIDERIVIYSILAAGLSFAMAILTLRERPPYFGSNDVMLALWMLLYGTLSLVRIAHQLSDPDVNTAFEALKGFGSVYAMAQTLTVQLLTLTLVSMNSQRIEHEYALSESRLRESEEQLRSIGDHLPDGFVYQFELRGGKRSFTYISAGVEKMLGLDPDQLRQDPQPLFAMMAPDSLTQYLEDEARCLRDLSEYSGISQFKLDDRRQVWLHVRSGVMRKFSDGAVWAGVAVDVTKLKLAEAELERHRHHLEAMVEQRTAALSEAKLAAEAANLAKGSFLANMSHEIRTPLNAIIGLSALLRGKQQNPDTASKLEKIEAAGKHLLGIINDILDISKIEAGKLELERLEFRLDTLLDQVAALVVNKATEKGIELILEISPDVPLGLVGDPLRLRQVLINYLNNAVKFTRQGEIGVAVSVEQAGTEGHLLRFEVSDTGIGIDPEQLERLFQSFVQADSSMTRQYGGTGLGLAISKRLAEAMGGEVGVRSELGRGSTFWFTARLGLGSVQPAQLVSDPDLRGHRMLVVDDSAQARMVLSRLLRNMGFEVVEVDGGSAALAEISQAEAAGHPYAVTFIDWLMPQMDGIAVADAILRLPLQHAPQRVICSASSDQNLVVAAQAVGVEQVLAKPVTASTLFDATMRLLGGHRSVQPTEQPASLLPGQGRQFRAAKLLLVEDNEINQEVGLALLQEFGLEVDLAADGAAALEQVQQQRYDLVLMDMQMPVMDGLEATRRIRALPGFGQLPIIAMTANAMAEDRQRCLEAGMNGHVAKPIEPAILWETLQAWLPAKIVPVAQPVAEPEVEPAAAKVPALAERAAATTPILPAELYALDGIDVATGLRQAMDKPGLYLSLLSRFVASQKDFRSAIRASLAQGDVMTAVRQAHTLKGLAGQIGAQVLSSTAASLEQALQQGAGPQQPDALIDEAGTRLEQLIKSLSPHLAAIAPEPLAVPFDREKFTAVRARLQKLLAESDSACQELAEQQAGLLHAGLGERYEALLGAIGDFDFDRALDSLKEPDDSDSSR